MLKPPMPGMTDTLEFVKNLWGGMQIPGVMPGMPGMPTPPLSVDELDKKIADLKAVEAWLNLNLGMLRGTIQALEIQRGTLATLRAMGDSMAQAMNQTGAASDAAMAPFAQFFSQAAQSAAKSAPAAPQASKPVSAPSETQPASQTDPKGAQTNPQPGAEAPHAGMPAAVAWWNLLQDQFRQAVASAMPAEGGAPPDKPGAGSPSPSPSQAGGSPLDVSGGAPESGPATSTGQDEPSGGQSGGGAPNGNAATGRRTARSKADKA